METPQLSAGEQQIIDELLAGKSKKKEEKASCNTKSLAGSPTHPGGWKDSSGPCLVHSQDIRDRGAGRNLHLNWHIRAIAHALNEVRRGRIKRLIITLPPRHLKSITASVAFPAYVLGHDPSKKIVCVSYSNELAVKHALDCRAVMKSGWFRLFPECRISSDKNTEWKCLTTMRGGRFATSVGGTLTGRGGNIIILDDPMNPKQAMSEALTNEHDSMVPSQRYCRGSISRARTQSSSSCNGCMLTTWSAYFWRKAAGTT